MSKFKYFCEKCKSPRPAKLEVILSDKENSSPQEKEIIRSFKHILPSRGVNGNSTLQSNETKLPDGSIERTFTGRQLDCNHFISLNTPAFTDLSTDNLNEAETLHIRHILDRGMIGLTLEQIKEKILRHVEEYQTLLKLANKTKQQAKYGLLQLDLLREKYTKSMSEDEKKSFDTKFYHWIDLKPTTAKTIEREKKEVKNTVDLENDLVAEMAARLRGKGFDPKKMFEKLKNKKEEV